MNNKVLITTAGNYVHVGGGEIKRLVKHRGVKLSSTPSGQRELIREMRNKINEIIDLLNKNE